MTLLVWLRNDLRLDDNPALYDACEAARQYGHTLRAVYCITPAQWQCHAESAAKLGLRSAALTALQSRLAAKGIVLDFVQGQWFRELGDTLVRYCRKLGVTDIWFNHEIPLDERRRDEAVVAKLTAAGIHCHGRDADMLLPRPVLNRQGDCYRVFTPWYRAWLGALSQESVRPLPEPEPVAVAKECSRKEVVLPGSGAYRKDLWPACESEAQSRLNRFAECLFDYRDCRNFPALNGTSTLSPYLASGLLSPRRCLQRAQQAAVEQGRDWRDSEWVRELAWREFYRYLLLHFPRLSQGLAFKPEAESAGWLQDPALFKCWQQGTTGFPIIDAGMRQLHRTGWMHNRLRMLCASFLTKLLLQDWRLGERFFMQQLIDGDFASNNGGWQWSASTGCDASPWFRVFNPIRQSRQFDPAGDFIKKMLPELASLDARTIHEPPLEVRRRLNYPAPLLDYRWARERALVHFKQASPGG